ncbi:hypothetical protein AB1Y20_000404 [Prymnesium parvum]|uniref:Major facilitator superfamily (MFS) profile domain-containing protein n=1 Tax=Prymnesium parvum TaxID=97485 RepID=A0AB34K8F8_PRYPA
MAPLVVRVACVSAIMAAVAAAIAADLLLALPGRSRRYKLARLRNWCATGAVYVLFYQARYAPAVVNTETTRDLLGVSPSGYGSILIAGFWAYAFATAVNGHTVDFLGGRVGLLVGCAGCAASSLLCGVILSLAAPPLGLFGVVHMCNMAFNSLAALSVLRINVNWYNERERGVFSGIFGVCISIGYFVALTAGSWFYTALPATYVFFMPACLLITLGVPLCCLVIRDTPGDRSHGEEIEMPVTPEPSSPPRAAERKGTPSWGASSYLQNAVKVLSLKPVQATMLGLVGLGWGREGFVSWFGAYLEATAGIMPGDETSTVTTTAMSLCAILGSLAGGFVSDRCCHSKRGPVVLVYCAGQLACLFLMWVTCGHAYASALACALIAVFLFGALSLLMAAASSDNVEPALAGMASGLLNAGQYMGSGAGAMYAGVMIDAFGWRALSWCCALGPMLTAAGMLWLMRVRRSASTCAA